MLLLKYLMKFYITLSFLELTLASVKKESYGNLAHR